ncbi:hypothetical protein OGAPHI_004785 [Ogataea philodendri]|uniref:Uncharacterized protein n=1 Tax=Ogataea philodendri TaxID=1378263 RepID=A0A9P8T3Q8_9ASCO|nr:uncharacterized protein OGAPHI_004785 [Ogataea philodendri]KAH3664071.1 hypothetical protein OGAPHI_004785 [Ogataea philodendri]
MCMEARKSPHVCPDGGGKWTYSLVEHLTLTPPTAELNVEDNQYDKGEALYMKTQNPVGTTKAPQKVRAMVYSRETKLAALSSWSIPAMAACPKVVEKAKNPIIKSQLRPPLWAVS